jgi:hypothetical protein
MAFELAGHESTIPEDPSEPDWLKPHSPTSSPTLVCGQLTVNGPMMTSATSGWGSSGEVLGSKLGGGQSQTNQANIR